MLRHVVLVNLKPGVTPSQVDSMSSRLEELVTSIPAVAAFSCGQDLGFVDGSSDYAIIVAFESEPDFQAYLHDPAHDDIAALIGALTASRTVVDFAA